MLFSLLEIALDYVFKYVCGFKLITKKRLEEVNQKLLKNKKKRKKERQKERKKERDCKYYLQGIVVLLVSK